MALQIDNTAIKSAAKRLEVIGNNVANANTVGFKGAEFLESLASAMSTETGATVVGGRQSFAQGDLSQSSNPLDIAISGAGFFRIENGEKVAYTRSGQFSLNKDGEIVNSMGDKLTGFLADPASGLIKSGKPTPLTVSQANDPPKPTSKASLELMLDSRSALVPAAAEFDKPALTAKAATAQATAVTAEAASVAAKATAAAAAATSATVTADASATTAQKEAAVAAATAAAIVAANVAATAATAAAAAAAAATAAAANSPSEAAFAAFDPADPTTYTHSTTTTVYSAQGNEVNVQTFYVKTADDNWDVYSWAGGTEPADKLGNLKFGSNGLVIASAYKDGTAPPKVGAFDINIDGTPMTLDLGSTTQYGSKFTVRVSQDGRGVGQLQSYSVAEDGIITARYNNGNSKVLGQVVLANFRSLNGLQPLGNSQWLESAASGSAEINQPGVGVLGSLKASSTESSNIDLTVEMIKMISAQRSFQAAAEMMRRQDESMQALNNIGR